MVELTTKEEDYILEVGREIDAERKEEWEREAQIEKEETPMREWIKDHKETLKSEFIVSYEDEFEQFCKEAWNNIE